MKHEWRKKEKAIYLPGNKPVILDIPAFKYFTIEGEGNPNSAVFPEYIGILYALSYAVKMSYKKGMAPVGYFDYTVYPLEGFWDIKEAAKKDYEGTLNKDDLVFKLMIRQPDFVDADFANKMKALTKEKHPHAWLDAVKFETIKEGPCVQMLHLGSYDSEPESFRIMEKFISDEGMQRISKKHKEIYLTDARKTVPDKLKTVLRFKVAKQL